METYRFRRAGVPDGLQEIVRSAVIHRRLIIPVEGNCMEGAGIEDGGRVAVDFTHYPRPGHWENGVHMRGDPCLCWATPPGELRSSLLCKVYDGVWYGHMVSTCYRQEEGKPFRMNGGFRADLILGVVYASWSRDGRLLWERDPESFPDTLPARVTMQGGNTDTGYVMEVAE